MWEEKTGGELCCLAAFDFFEVLEKTSNIGRYLLTHPQRGTRGEVNGTPPQSL